MFLKYAVSKRAVSLHKRHTPKNSFLATKNADTFNNYPSSYPRPKVDAIGFQQEKHNQNRRLSRGRRPPASRLNLVDRNRRNRSSNRLCLTAVACRKRRARHTHIHAKGNPVETPVNPS